MSILMIETEEIFETLALSSTLPRLIAREDVSPANFVWDPVSLFVGNNMRGLSGVLFSCQSSALPWTLMLQTSRSRARNRVRPPPIWEFVNGSRDLLFRGVSSSNLSINNLLCGLEDLYFPLKCAFFRCRNLFHLSFGQILGNISIGRIFLEVVVSHESQVYSDFPSFVPHFTGSEKLWADHFMLALLIWGGWSELQSHYCLYNLSAHSPHTLQV
jgi:hypothetical protein